MSYNHPRTSPGALIADLDPECRRSQFDALSVFVIDDDRGVAETITAMVASLGADVRFACDAESFFAGLRERRADVVIVDLMMPDRDGLEVLRDLGQYGPVQVVVSSGCDTRVMETARLSAQHHGLDVLGFLPKPVRRKAMCNLLQLARSSAAPGAGPGAAGKAARAARPVLARPILTRPMLAQAIAEGQIAPYFQPKLRLLDDKPCGFEALARWEHPDHGTIYPDEFIPLASSAELDFDLSCLMLTKSFEYLVSFDRPDLTVAVNVPLSVCAGAPFANVLENLLDRFDVPAEHLMLEVTEAGASGMTQPQIDNLMRLRMRGVSLSIDDFGTGVSSLERLVKIPFDELKIDRFFARDIGSSRRARGVIRALVQMAKSLGMSVVIEGVEHARDIKISRDLGCDAAQGYHIARPMNIHDTRAWLAGTNDKQADAPGKRRYPAGRSVPAHAASLTPRSSSRAREQF